MQSSTEQWELRVALSSAVVQMCRLIAHLQEQQGFTGVFAGKQHCQLFLHSNMEQWGVHVALSSATVHWCQVTAHLSEQQIFTCVYALLQVLL